MSRHDAPLIYAHIGDLHLTSADQPNHADFAAIVDELAGPLKHAFDFVFLPGDNADNGTVAQYALVACQLARLPVPVEVITGDHDMEQGDLDAFYGTLHVPRLPRAMDYAGVRCLFLDVCGPGTGGPDFRIGAEQAGWLTDALADAADEDRRVIVFIHTYPDDMKGDGETRALNTALAGRHVLLVDMGHTHYNELANDGRTIFAATRSTGQIEEGPVGYAIVALDGPVVSWRFRELGASRPIVLVTSPADRRLAMDTDEAMSSNQLEIRASVLSEVPIVDCVVEVDSAAPVAMEAIGANRFQLLTKAPDAASTITVRARDASGGVGHETIELAGRAGSRTTRVADGSDADAIGAWPERGILGTQLGPNRNGRQW